MIYLAGSSKDKEYVGVVSDHIAREGVEVLAPWLRWSQTTHPDESHNWKVLCGAIRKAQATVVVAPPFGQISQGSILEAGYTLGLGKPVYLLMRNSEDSPSRVGHWCFAPTVEYIWSFSDLVSAISWTKGY